jgi:hypothetical protein
LAGGKVLPMRTGGVPGWHRAGGGEVGLTLAAARREGRSSGSGAEAVADVGEGRVPVSGGVVLWLEVEAREVVVARCQSGEEKMRRGGGLEGWVPRGSGAAWSSVAEWRRLGSGPAAACAGGALPRDSGGRRGRRDARRRG